MAEFGLAIHGLSFPVNCFRLEEARTLTELTKEIKRLLGEKTTGIVYLILTHSSSYEEGNS